MDFLSTFNAKRILIAESNPDVMDGVAALLEAAGYNIHKAYYAGDAIYMLQNSRLDLALIDTHMADREQRTLASRMDEFSEMVWIAVVDAHDQHPDDFLRKGAAAYLHRPLKREAVLTQIKHVLEGQKMEMPAATPPAPVPKRDEFSQKLERRLVEQQTLSALARSLSAVLDLDSLLSQVVDAAVRLCNAEEGMLLLPDENGRALYVRAVKGIDSATASSFRIKTQDTLAGQVFHSGEPLLVGDQGWQKIKTEYLVKSLLYVPLSIKGQTIGVLGINNKLTDRTFNKHDTELLQDLAAHAAIAIENARLYEESLNRTRELSRLVQAGEAANSSLAIDRVLSVIAGELIGALGVSQCYIGEWDQRQLNTLAVCTRALWATETGPQIAIRDNPAIRQAFTEKRIILGAGENTSNPTLKAWMPHRTQAETIVYIPLFTQDHPIGLITLYHIHQVQEESRYPATVYRQIQQIALEMSVSLAGARVNLNQDTLFRAAQRIMTLTSSDWCEVALLNPTNRQINLMLSHGEAIWREGAGFGLDLNRFGQLADVLSGQRTFTDSNEGDFQVLTEKGYGKSFLAIPLVIKGRMSGLVVLADTLHTRHFSRREIELAQALVSQAANAIDNAHLFRDLERSLEELRRTQSKLVQTARLSAMGELAAAVAHQINNPLTTILGDTELILQDLPDDDPNAEALAAVLRAGKRAHEVVRRLLGMARQKTSEDLQELLDLNETISNTLMLVKSHVQQGNVQLHIDLGEQLRPVMAIRGELEDVWLNLLLNARDAVANRPNPQIGIQTWEEGDHNVITIWDNGVGIPEALQRQIFEPFFTTKPAGEGTGLGLHICRQIVEKSQGSIHLESAYNQGTRFTIFLPAFDRREDDS